MTHALVSAVVAVAVVGEFPVQRLALALLAKVERKRVGPQELDQRIQISDAVLQWRPRQTPLRKQKDNKFSVLLFWHA